MRKVNKFMELDLAVEKEARRYTQFCLMCATLPVSDWNVETFTNYDDKHPIVRCYWKEKVWE